jgi:hypothetical protein
MPRECPLAFRSVPVVAGIGSTKRRSVRPPIAIAPIRCHVRCCALRAKAQCGVHADLGGLTQRHNHGRLIRSLDDAAGVPALSASWGWHQPVRGLAASRCGWLRSFERREESRDRRKSDDVCCPAWLGRLDSVPSAAPKNCPDRTAVHDRPRPVNLSQRASQSSKEKWISCQMPASCQSRNRRQQVMPEPQPSSCGSISQGIPLRRTNRIPVKQARSGKRGLPLLGLRGEGGSSG